MNLSSVSRLFFIVIILTTCDDNRSETPLYKYQIRFNYHAGQLIFTDLPVSLYFSVTHPPENEKKPIVWSFGEGSTSDQSFAGHVYSEPGVYTISLKSGEEVLADTVIEVIPKPPLVGSLNGYEEGNFFYQDENSNYIILYNDVNASDSFFLGIASEYFETKDLRPLTYLSNWYFECATPSRNGFLLPYPPQAMEISNSGALVTQSVISPGNSFRPKDIIQTETGYKIIGEASGTVIFCDLNQNLQTQILKAVKIFEFSSSIPSVYFEGSDLIRIHHSKPFGSGNVDMITQDLNGDVLHQTTYPEDLALMSFKFQGGYLLFGYIVNPSLPSTHTYNFSITDMDAKIISTKQIVVPKDEQAPLRGKQPHIGFIEHGNFLYAFFGAMQILKLTKTGEIVWEKTFATVYDRFRSVIVNNNGHFVLMGEHHYDPEKEMYTDAYGRRDLIFIEVDESGNYLYVK